MCGSSYQKHSVGDGSGVTGVGERTHPNADLPPHLLPQQGQHALGQLIGLRHHGGTGLLQDLGA